MRVFEDLDGVYIEATPEEIADLEAQSAIDAAEYRRDHGDL